MATHFVAVPNWIDIDGEWKDIEEFESEEEALKFVQEQFGADERGRISLVSAIESEDELYADWKVVAQTEIRQALQEAVWDKTDKVVSVDNEICQNYEEFVGVLFGIADIVFTDSGSPERLDASEVEEWISSAAKHFEDRINEMGWSEANSKHVQD